MQNITQWVTASNWQHLAGMLWKDMRLLAVRLDNAQRLAMCWVRWTLTRISRTRMVAATRGTAPGRTVGSSKSMGGCSTAVHSMVCATWR